jgi:aromatic ring-opening dioxygenase LigB subunit
MPILFAAISPHPPLILPIVGSKQDKEQVKETITSLESLGKKAKELNLDTIIISSPHPDWGFQVPLFYLAPDFQGKIETFLTDSQDPAYYFEQGKKVYAEYGQNNNRLGLIASGDLSHYLKSDGAYGFKDDGPKFDQALVKALKEKDTERILTLSKIYPKAGECGLRSICFILGILQSAKINWQADILSYQGPFGVGYLVADLKV